jgi:hypothetical protein
MIFPGLTGAAELIEMFAARPVERPSAAGATEGCRRRRHLRAPLDQTHRLPSRSVDGLWRTLRHGLNLADYLRFHYQGTLLEWWWKHVRMDLAHGMEEVRGSIPLSSTGRKAPVT